MADKRPISDDEEEDGFQEYVPIKHRKLAVVKKVAQKRKMPSIEDLRREEERKRKLAVVTSGPQSQRSLLEEYAVEKHEKEMKNESKIDELLKEEQAIMARIRADTALKSVQELAGKGTTYTTSAGTSWRAPKYILARDEEHSDAMRAKWHIEVDGEDIAPPITNFAGMKYHKAIVAHLTGKGITRPTPVQMQGLPVLLSGRDMVGVAFTGSGKTLCFALPLIQFCLEQEKKMPFLRGEGPYGVIMAPSRELARQTYDEINELCKALEDWGEPKVRAVLTTGGVDMRSMMEGNGGVHIAIATPGRLKDVLKRERMNFECCKYFCLDEADRMIDMGFEEDIRDIMSYFKGQRQMVLFSATMPTKIKDFAYSALVNPVTVNVGRAGAANLDVIQEVEYVKQEAKVMYLLECLQKTPPPVMVFSARKQDVDDMYEYLLLKGVEAVAIHGGKEQEEREFAITSFKDGRKDVLVCSDVASKGLDFQNIQHVINFDMPEELEDYVHRIGRTGRCGKTGIATTFINKMVSQTTLMDLKHLLMEAKQRVPPFLQAYTNDSEAFLNVGGIKGCLYCGGPGHRIADCPKRKDASDQATRSVGRSDFTRENDSEY